MWLTLTKRILRRTTYPKLEELDEEELLVNLPARYRLNNTPFQGSARQQGGRLQGRITREDHVKNRGARDHVGGGMKF